MPSAGVEQSRRYPASEPLILRACAKGTVTRPNGQPDNSADSTQPSNPANGNAEEN